jgi:hypothetical protein
MIWSTDFGSRLACIMGTEFLSKLTILLGSGLLIRLLFSAGLPVAAQIEESQWATPINLSQSGASSGPLAVVDSTGVVHVIWQDQFSGFVYTRRTAEGWATPETVDLPFGFQSELGQQPPSPLMLLLRKDVGDRIHAIWKNGESTLLYSSVPADAFANSSAWTDERTLASGVLTSDFAVDDRGSLHLGYIRSLDTPDQPSGVYFRRSDDGGVNWIPTTLIDQSPYFRSLSSAETNVRVTTSEVQGTERVFVAWDNRARERVYMARSNDNGQSWELPLEVDRRQAEDAEVAVGPSNINIAASGDEVHLVWQAGHQGMACRQYHQWSSDGGDSWELPHVMLAGVNVCPVSNILLVDENGSILLLAIVEDTVQSGVFLLAWDGERWSEPQEQEPLSSFVDPDTFRSITVACLRAILSGEELIVVGCSRDPVADIWLITRPIGEWAGWFPPPPAWQAPYVLETSSTRILPPVIATDAQGWVHIFWSELNSARIKYARWDGSRWSTPLPVLTSPTGTVHGMNVVVTPNGRLLVTWTDDQAGRLYLGQTGITRGLFSEDWIIFQPIPLVGDGISSPELIVDSNGVIYVAYAVPINEGRGIYVMRSGDLGRSWSEPIRAFDGEAAGWTIVDRPQLALAGGQDLHMMWVRDSLTAGAGPHALAYARSDDSGMSWSEPQVVVEAPLAWSRIASVGDSVIHRLWQVIEHDRSTLWHETSTDGGLTWSHGTLIVTLSIANRVVQLSQDPAGQLHVLYTDDFGIQYRFWNGTAWLHEEGLALSPPGLGGLDSLALTVTADDSLSAVYVDVHVKQEGGTNEEEPFILNFSSRYLELPEALPTPLPDLTPMPQQMPALVPTLTTSPATPRFQPPADEEPEDTAQLFATNTELIVVTSVITVSFLVLAALIWVAQRERRMN